MHDCLVDLLDLPVLNLERFGQLDITWPREQARGMQIQLGDLLRRLEIAGVTLTPVD